MRGIVEKVGGEVRERQVPRRPAAAAQAVGAFTSARALTP
jgi:hypothetical protein